MRSFSISPTFFSNLLRLSPSGLTSVSIAVWRFCRSSLALSLCFSKRSLTSFRKLSAFLPSASEARPANFRSSSAPMRVSSATRASWLSRSAFRAASSAAFLFSASCSRSRRAAPSSSSPGTRSAAASSRAARRAKAR